MEDDRPGWTRGADDWSGFRRPLTVLHPAVPAAGRGPGEQYDRKQDDAERWSRRYEYG